MEAFVVTCLFGSGTKCKGLLGDFMNFRKMLAPILVTICIVLYFVVYFGFLITLVSSVWKYALGIVPPLLACAMVKVCIDRIKEIKKGEEDDISQY